MSLQIDDWFQIEEIAEKVFLLRESEHVQSYLVVGETRSALLDTGMGFRDIRPVVESLCDHEIIVLNSHWHFDHVGGNHEFEQIGISALEQHKLQHEISSKELNGYVRSCRKDGIPLPDGFQAEMYSIHKSSPSFILAEGERVDLGGRTLEVIATPGHTHGSLSFLDSFTHSLFCADLVYDGDLYAQFDDSDLDEYISSLKKLIARRGDFSTLFPSHNTAPLPVSFLDLVLDGLNKIWAGKESYAIHEDWGEAIQVYDFDQFRVLLKMSGSEGIRLFSI